jgi:hypothetical protein
VDALLEADGLGLVGGALAALDAGVGLPAGWEWGKG